jgi:long-chain acyl-CoA synthetase
MADHTPVHVRFMTNTATARVAALHVDNGEVRHTTVGQLQDLVRRCAHVLAAHGVTRGDRVAVLIPTSLEHTIVDIAALCLGAIVVPVYDTDSYDQIRWILEDADPVVFVTAAEMHNTVTGAKAAIAHRCEVLIAGELAERYMSAEACELDVVVSDSAEGACIVYTSGTTGRSKGCLLAHGNITSAIDAASAALPELFRGGARTVLFLPLAHVFARVVQYGCLAYSVEMGYSSPTAMITDVQLMQPTWLVAVPRVLEKVYAGARAKSTGAKAKLFDISATVARAHAKGVEDGSSRALLEPAHWVLDKLVYKHIRAALGGSVRHVISGGAALDADLNLFFTGCGITVLEGYGLTETTAAHTVNTTSQRRAGSVGHAIGTSEVRVRSGELQLRGPNVFSGYWRNDDATAEAFDQGWFRTGDLGEVDAGGFVRVTGRIKELIVTAGGKNVQPVGLEEIVVRSPAVSQCVVVGDGEPFIAALVVLDPLWVAARALELGLPLDDVSKHSTTTTIVQSAVDGANDGVSRAESIREWRLLPAELSVDNGMLTPTMKTKRVAVVARYETVLKDIYSKSADA